MSCCVTIRRHCTAYRTHVVETWRMTCFAIALGIHSPNRRCGRREESEHRSALRRAPAFQTIATLCQLAAEARIGGQTSPTEVLRDATLAPLQSFQAQEKPEKGGKGRAQRQVIGYRLGRLSPRRPSCE